MPSKMVTDRQKTAANLSGTVDVYAEQAADNFLSLLGPHLDEETPPPNLVYLQTLLRRRLDQLGSELIEVDEAHRAERKEERKLRLQRDTAARELKMLVAQLRGLIDRICGPGTSYRLLDIESRIPRDPVVLLRVAKRMLSGLRQGLLDEKSSLFPGVVLDASAWASLLEDPMERLENALVGLAQEQPETGNRLVNKASAMKEYDRAYRATANLLESLFRYVGRADLAKRIRPKKRSPTSEGGDSPDPDPPTSTPNDPPAPPDFDLPIAAI